MLSKKALWYLWFYAMAINAVWVCYNFACLWKPEQRTTKHKKKKKNYANIKYELYINFWFCFVFACALQLIKIYVFVILVCVYGPIAVFF